MTQSTDDDVTLQVVDVGGEPIWQACWRGVCVRDHSGAMALERLRLVQLNSQPQPLAGPGLSQRGLSPRKE